MIENIDGTNVTNMDETAEPVESVAAEPAEELAEELTEPKEPFRFHRKSLLARAGQRRRNDTYKRKKLSLEHLAALRAGREAALAAKKAVTVESRRASIEKRKDAIAESWEKAVDRLSEAEDAELRNRAYEFEKIETGIFKIMQSLKEGRVPEISPEQFLDEVLTPFLLLNPLVEGEAFFNLGMQDQSFYRFGFRTRLGKPVYVRFILALADSYLLTPNEQTNHRAAIIEEALQYRFLPRVIPKTEARFTTHDPTASIQAGNILIAKQQLDAERRKAQADAAVN